jgi:hypothetical protein
MQVIDIFTDFGADLVRFRTNKMVLVWRHQEAENTDFRILEEAEDSAYPSSIRKLVTLAIVCCILARNYLKESEVWVLEDISDEYSGYKIDCRFGVGFGSLMDGQVGIRGFRMEHLVLGEAYEEADNSLMQCKSFGDIYVAKQLRDISEPLLQLYHVEMIEEDEAILIHCPIQVDNEKVRDLYSQISPNIVFSDREMSGFSNATVETYLADSGAHLLREMKKEKKSVKLHNGQWLPCVFVSIRIQTHPSEGNVEGFSTHEYIQAYQKYMELILKASRKYDIYLHKVSVLDNRDLLLACVTFGGDPEKYVLAIRMAIYCMELFDQKIRASIGITSGLAYEGLLKSVHRTSYRLVSWYQQESETMAIHYTHIGILCDLNTYEKTQGHPIQGLFYELGKRDLQVGISKYRITSLGSQSEKRGGLKRQMNTKIAQEHMLKLQQIISAPDEDGVKKNILIEGNAGSGKTYTLKRIYKMLERNSYTIWYEVLI